MEVRKLLLADDSLTIQKVVNLTFADEGIEVVTVGDGDSAVHRVFDEIPDLVLADVNMPGLNGYEVCELIRSDTRTSHIPVILLIGAFEQFDEEEAARVGASAHLTKPFQSIRQLVNQVTDMIEEGKRTSKTSTAEPQNGTDATSIENEAASPVTASDPFDEPIRSQFETFREDRIASMDQHPEATDEQHHASQPLEPPAVPSQVEVDDIDRLYRQSIGEGPVDENRELPDLGVDDEMIETSYSSSQPENVDLQIEQHYGSFQTVEAVGADVPKAEDLNETQPLSTYETTDLTSANPPYEIEHPEPKRHGETVRLDPALVDAQMAEANRRFEPIEQPPPPLSEAAPPIGEDTIRMDSRFDTKGTSTFEFDEADLLDIPPETPVEVTTASDAAARGGDKQIVTLSPELIEMIAQRVVEKLSEKY